MPDRFDVFISYSRGQLDWVMAKLYAPLCACQTLIGEPAKIYLDVSPDGGLQAGSDFRLELQKRIAECKKFVPVISFEYFDRPYCSWELKRAGDRKVEEPEFIVPLHLEDPRQWPLSDLQGVNYTSVLNDDWFARLLKSLRLKLGDDQLELELLDQPPTSTTVHQNLPPLRVGLRDKRKGPSRSSEHEIEMQSQCGQLYGSRKVKTSNGIATFGELLIGKPAAETRLIALSQGLKSVESRQFVVESPSVTVQDNLRESTQIPPQPPQILNRGVATFFPSGRALTIVADGHVTVFQVDGRSLIPAPGIPLLGPLRWQRSAGPYLVLADWSSNIFLLADDGRYVGGRVSHAQVGSLPVPADIAFAQDDVWMGLWNGEVYKLSFTAPPTLVYKHAEGVQALTYAQGTLYIADMEGNLVARRDGNVLKIGLEPRLHFVRWIQDRLVVIGSRQLYQVYGDLSDKVQERVPLDSVAAVYGDTRQPLMIDAQGKGCRLDEHLRLPVFHAAPGAVPRSADDGGKYAVFEQADGSFSLMFKRQTIYSHNGGCLSVSPNGALLAVGEADGTRLVPVSLFEKPSRSTPS